MFSYILPPMSHHLEQMVVESRGGLIRLQILSSSAHVKGQIY